MRRRKPSSDSASSSICCRNGSGTSRLRLQRQTRRHANILLQIRMVCVEQKKKADTMGMYVQEKRMGDLLLFLCVKIRKKILVRGCERDKLIRNVCVLQPPKPRFAAKNSTRKRSTTHRARSHRSNNKSTPSKRQTSTRKPSMPCATPAKP